MLAEHMAWALVLLLKFCSDILVINMQGPLLVWVSFLFTCLEKLKYLIAEATLQNYALFSFQYFLHHLLAFLE